MPLKEDATHEESREYYEDFSLRVGLRDWLRPSKRHAALRHLVGEAVGERTGLRLLDVGCGAGVMSSYLTRYGAVVGTDFSAAAIDAASRLVPEAQFYAGDLSMIPDGPYDVITLFDVLEHIPAAERPALLGELRSLLRGDGILFMSTPYPAFTHRRKAERDPTLQIIDEEVEVTDVAHEARQADLQLVAYKAFDVFAGSPEYQAMTFSPTGGSLGDGPKLHVAGVELPSERRWRVRQAVRLAKLGRRRTARWFLTARPPHIES